jgi:surfactin synthase thioesterase subunit
MQPPGRESRFSEPPKFTVDEVADAIQEAVRPSVPYSIYGHSLGGLVAFAVAQELNRRGARLPDRLFLAACRAPEMAREQARNLLALPDAEFLDVLVRMGGMPAEVQGEPGLLGLMLRVVRADFEWMAGYRHDPEPALPVPIVAFAGASDASASPQTMADWAVATTAGLTVHTLAGGHFFLQRQLLPLVAHILDEWPAARA